MPLIEVIPDPDRETKFTPVIQDGAFFWIPASYLFSAGNYSLKPILAVFVYFRVMLNPVPDLIRDLSASPPQPRS